MKSNLSKQLGKCLVFVAVGISGCAVAPEQKGGRVGTPDLESVNSGSKTELDRVENEVFVRQSLQVGEQSNELLLISSRKPTRTYSPTAAYCAGTVDEIKANRINFGLHLVAGSRIATDNPHYHMIYVEPDPALSSSPYYQVECAKSPVSNDVPNSWEDNWDPNDLYNARVLERDERVRLPVRATSEVNGRKSTLMMDIVCVKDVLDAVATKGDAITMFKGSQLVVFSDSKSTSPNGEMTVIFCL